MKKLLLAAVVLSIVVAAPATAEDSILKSLPDEVQKEIEDVRAGCREQLMRLDGKEGRADLAWKVPGVSSGDEGLDVFTVSGSQAVMVDDLELCGGECVKWANCSNRGAYGVAIYIRSGKGWRKALSTEATGRVFLSTDMNDKFKALVVNVFSGNKDCPTRDVVVRKGRESYPFPAWKQSCAAVVKWNGTKFTFKPL
jgi:hypothetical protein